MRELMMRLAPNPMRKLSNCPEKMPVMAVQSLPFLAKAVMDM